MRLFPISDAIYIKKDLIKIAGFLKGKENNPISSYIYFYVYLTNRLPLEREKRKKVTRGEQI